MKKFLRSFGYAWNGLRGSTDGTNFQVLLIISAALIILDYAIGVSGVEFAISILSIGLVLSAEASNTAIEKLCDKLHPDIHPAIGVIKDIAAGATLVACIAAGIANLIVFWPHLF